MTADRLTGLALRSYPPSFRERYGAELEALVEDTGSGLGATVDLLRGSAKAWLRPTIAGSAPERRRRRLQASVTTTWLAWCAGFLVAPAVNRLLLDPPVAGLTPADRHLLTAASWLFAAGWVLAAIGVVPLAVQVVTTAHRNGTLRELRPLVLGVALGVLDGGLLAALVLVRHTHSSAWAHPSGLFIAMGIAFLVVFVAFVAVLGLAPAHVVTRVRPEVAWLRLPSLVALPVALCLAAMTAVSAIAVNSAGWGPIGAGVLAVSGVAALTALLSSGRGLFALR